MNLTYPTIDKSSYPHGFEIFGLEIRFYAIFIILGGFTALFLSTYRGRKKGYPLDFFFTIFLVAFPLGIVGARIWYVIAEFDSMIGNNFGETLWNIINMRDGGLAIQGGAILGILSGVVFARFRRRNAPLLMCADFAVPTILVAQAIGRLGNFFNQEVYGRAIDPSAWSFVFPFITNNMTGGAIGSDFVAPLFLVEAILNIGGYFFIVYLVEGCFNKYTEHGDLTFLYLVVYGFIRMVMEPMRNPTFIMGNSEEKMKSFGMALAFIIVGIILIIVNHLLRFFDRKGKFKNVKFINWLLQRNLDVQTNTLQTDVKDLKPSTFDEKEENKSQKFSETKDDDSMTIKLDKSKLEKIERELNNEEKK